MTTYKTGNPVPSAAVRDLYDNAENLDSGINGPAPTWTDRLGVVRRSWAGVLAEFDQFIADNGLKRYDSWAQLQADTSRDVGFAADVIGDDGTHTDPVSGDAVPNSGQYRWNGSAWEFMRADTLSEAISRITGLDRSIGGYSEVFASPNVFPDSGLRQWSAGTNAGVVAPDGSGTYSVAASATLSLIERPDGGDALRYSMSGVSNIAWRRDINSLGWSAGAVFSASVRILRGNSIGQTRVLLRQLNGGSEITSARRSAVIANGAVGDQTIEFSGVEINAGATHVSILIDGNNASTWFEFTDVLVAAGRVAGFRPSIIGRVLTESDMKVINDRESWRWSRNVYPDPRLADAGDALAWPGIGSGLTTPVVSKGGARAFVTPASAGATSRRSQRFNVSQFLSGRISASLVVFEKIGDQGANGIQIRLVAFNAAGTQLNWSAPGDEGGLSNYYARKLPRTDIRSPTTVIIASGVQLPAGTVEIALDLRIETTVQAYASNIVIREGDDSSFIDTAAGPWPPAPAAQRRAVWIGPSGNDESGAGTAASPYATLDRAIDAVDGSGTVTIMHGNYDNMRITPAKVRGRVSIVGDRPALAAGDYDFPTIRLATKITGISKTAGRAKIYQAAVAGLPSLASHQWAYQDGVADPRTLIAPDDRSPQHRGRTHRVPWFAMLVKTTSTTLEAALDEMDASGLPMSFVDSGVLYFTVVDGGDGTSADIYLDAPTGLVNSAAIGSAGSLEIAGLRVLYGGIDLRPFRSADLDEVVAAGARNNVIDYNVLRYGTLEVACAGSRNANNGDGLNGHNGAVITRGLDLYAHDCRDDGFSDHEGCSSRMHGGLVEYNGGSGVAPAYGSDHVGVGIVSRRNQRLGTFKQAAFAVIGSPSGGGPAEQGVDTRALWINCVDIESLTSFFDARSAANASHCINCKSIRPVTLGYSVSRVTDCGYAASATSTARHAATVVDNTAAVA